MRIIRQENLKRIEIEYDVGIGERQKVFDWLDETYGALNWRSQRSGPIGDNKGLVIALVDIDYSENSCGI